MGVTGDLVDGVTAGLSGHGAACTAAVVLAGLMAVLTYVSLRDSQVREHERDTMNRQMMLELLETCPLNRPTARGDRIPMAPDYFEGDQP